MTEAVRVLEPRDINQVQNAGLGVIANDKKPANAKSSKKKKEKLSSLCKTPPQVIRARHGQDYERGSFLGEGGFARCFQVRDNTGVIYAAKTVAKASLKSGKVKDKLLAEIKIHKSLRHPNIVQFVDCFEDDSNVYILLEICENQSLMDMLRTRKKFTEQEAKYFIVQILGAVSYMHKRGVIHRDLKLGNIFIGENMDVKIGDFGLATVLSSDKDRKKTICGTPNYIAPEVLFGKKEGHSYEADIWSIGVILYAMLFGKPPFQCKEVDDIYDRIKHNSYSFPSTVKVSEDAMDLISSLLVHDPQKRLGIDEILQHPFFECDFPSMIPSFSLSKKPNFGSVSRQESMKNFINCQVASRLRLAERKGATALVSVDEPVNIEETVKSNTDTGAASVLPTSLSPASTKDKYKLVLVHRKSGLDLKQQQQQKLKLTGEYAHRIQEEQEKKDKVIPAPRWTRAATRIIPTGTTGTQEGDTERVASSRLSATKTTQITAKTSSLSPFNPKESLYRTLETITKAVNMYESNEPILPIRKFNHPAVFISKWVDFSERYGLAYQTADENVGVLFRNSTVLLMNPDNDSYLLFDKEDPDQNSLVSNWVGKAISKSTTIPSESKAIRLINTFYKYMEEQLRKNDYGIEKSDKKDLSANPVFITHYDRQDNYVMLRLNNGTYQFNFPDHIKVILSNEANQVDLIDTEQNLHTWSIQEAVAFCRQANDEKLVSDPTYDLVDKLITCHSAIKHEYRTSF